MTCLGEWMECVIFYANSIFMNFVICHCQANRSMKMVLQLQMYSMLGVSVF